MLPIIKILKQRHKDGQEIEALISVTENQEAIQAQLEQFKQANLDLVLQKDNEHHRAVNLEGRARKSLQLTVTTLRERLEALESKEYGCQALKKDGSRCTRPAKVKTNWNGVEINTCLQHNK